MASETFCYQIEQGAKFLTTPTAQKARGYLAPPLETALKVLDCFADGKPHGFEEVAEDTGLAANTVKQVIRSLKKGRYPFTFTYAEVKTTGRPPLAIQKKKVSRQ